MVISPGILFKMVSITFITVDLAGNRRTLIIAVTGGEMTVQEDSMVLPDIASPLMERFTIDEASVRSDPVNGVSNGLGSPLRNLGILVCGVVTRVLVLYSALAKCKDCLFLSPCRWEDSQGHPLQARLYSG